MSRLSRSRPIKPDDPTGRRLVVIDYTNHRGERSKRTIEPLTLFFGSNQWHRNPQWLLDAWDVDKQAARNFAMKDVHSWEPAA